MKQNLATSYCVTPARLPIVVPEPWLCEGGDGGDTGLQPGHPGPRALLLCGHHAGRDAGRHSHLWLPCLHSAPRASMSRGRPQPNVSGNTQAFIYFCDYWIGMLSLVPPKLNIHFHCKFMVADIGYEQYLLKLLVIFCLFFSKKNYYDKDLNYSMCLTRYSCNKFCGMTWLVTST